MSVETPFFHFIKTSVICYDGWKQTQTDQSIHGK